MVKCQIGESLKFQSYEFVKDCSLISIKVFKKSFNVFNIGNRI